MDNLLWLVPVVAAAIIVPLAAVIIRFYSRLRMLPWQVAADKRRKLQAFARLEADYGQREIRERWRRNNRLFLIIVGLAILAVIALASCTTVSRLVSGNQYPYGKSYYQNNPACRNHRP